MRTLLLSAVVVCLLGIGCLGLLVCVSTPGAAATTNLTDSAAEDVLVTGNATTTQTVQFSFTPNYNATEQVTITPHNIPTTAIHQANTTVRDSAHVSVTDPTVTDGVISFNLSHTNQSQPTATTVTTTVTYNKSTLSAADATTDATYTIASADSQSSTTAVFNLQYRTADVTRTAGSQTVFNQTPVYQGEDDLQFIDADGQRIDVTAFEKTAGQGEGTTLSLPIAQTSPAGTYTDPTSGMTVTVREPRITTAEIQRNNNTVNQLPAVGATNLSVVADWNFPTAEKITITVEDPNGDDVTRQVVSNQSFTTPGDSRTLSLADEGPGEYTIVFEGTTTLDYEAVVETRTIEITDTDSLTITSARENVTRGDTAEYTITGGLDTDTHLIMIDASQFRDSVNQTTLTNTFRNVGDTVETGVWNATAEHAITTGDSYNRTDIAYAYAIVEIDGSEADGELATRSLTDTRVDVTVYSATGEETYSGPQQMRTLAPFAADSSDVVVREGNLSLETPTDAYTIGQTVAVRGTAESAETVGLYVRDATDWVPVGITDDSLGDAHTLSVDSDGSFSADDVTLSDADATTPGGNRILAFEGRYRIAIVDMADVPNTTTSLSPSTLRTTTYETYPLVAAPGNLNAQFELVGGQVAAEDAVVDITGTASGQSHVAYAFVDSRGDSVSGVISVNRSTGAFETEDIRLDSLAHGRVTGYVISVGRDGVPGAGSTGPIAGSDAAAIADYIASLSGSRQQIHSRITAHTVNASGSDDVVVSDTFRYDDGRVSISSVYPASAEADGIYPVAIDETVVIETQTTRRPNTTPVTVAVLTDDGETLVESTTDQWGSDGRITTQFPADEIGLGPFTVEVTSGNLAAREQIQLVTERDTRLGYEAPAENITVVENRTGSTTLRVSINRSGREAVAIGGLSPDTVSIDQVSNKASVQDTGIVWTQPANETVSFTLRPPDTVSPGDSINFTVVDIRQNQRTPVSIRAVEQRVTGSTSATEADPSTNTTSPSTYNQTEEKSQPAPIELTNQSSPTQSPPAAESGSSARNVTTTTTERVPGFGVIVMVLVLVGIGLFTTRYAR